MTYKTEYKIFNSYEDFLDCLFREKSENNSYKKSYYSYEYNKENNQYKYYLAGLSKKDINIKIEDDIIEISKTEGKDSNKEILIQHQFNNNYEIKEATMENGLLIISLKEPKENSYTLKIN